MKKMDTYKPAKKLDEQIEHLRMNKRVQYHLMDETEAKDKLLRYNYINVISPFKHHFAKKDKKHKVIKINNAHVYEKEVEFKEYYDYFRNERDKYPIMIKNILYFDIHFKSMMAYHILTNIKIEDSIELEIFLNSLENNLNTLPTRYHRRLSHMRLQLFNLKNDISKFGNIYCFFDRMSLGHALTVFICLEKKASTNYHG